MLYLDNAATTKPYPEVIATMSEAMEKYWANPSGNNSLSDEVRNKIEAVREQFAADLNCKPSEIIFVSGGCEANSLAIKGFLNAHGNYKFYTSYLEHSSINMIIDDITYLQYGGRIPNDSSGNISVDELNKKLYKNDSPFVSICAANSELGVIQDIKSLAKVAHNKGGIFHCDAVQLFPEQRIDVKDWNVDMLSISAQKFHGPRGFGILYIKEGTVIDPLIYGSQEGGLRGGTYNTAAILGAGKALELTRKHNATENIRAFRNQLYYKLDAIPDVALNGPSVWKNRLANNISLRINGVNAEKLVTMCDLMGLIIARGSACHSHIPTPSPALKAISLSDEEALSTVRITLDEFTTEQEVNEAAEIITKLVERIRDEKETE